MAEGGVDERVAKLTLTEEKHGLALNETITARTLARSDLDTTIADPRSVGSVADLPRITVDTREPKASSPSLTPTTADLAILSTIGEGGMGRVYLARQRSLGREVALKTLKPDANPVAAHALLIEARITGLLEHPGVIPVHALGVDGAQKPVIVMKRVDGVDLATRLAGQPQRAEKLVAVVEALVQVCRTLEFAHARGIIHRDIKPENIIVGGFGEVYLLDWGIATTKEDAAKHTSDIVGTPVYMAPELVTGEPADERTDVYLLGATLHEVLTGRPRHGGKTILEVTKNALLSEAVRYPSDVPEELARLCNRCTSPERGERPEDTRAVREALTAFLRHLSAHAFAAAALERVVSIETTLESTNGTPKDLAQAYRWIAEARFGLTQSVREGAADDIAKDGMRRCIRAAIELELRQDHVESAEALAAELTPADADITRRIEERRAAVSEREREHERLVNLDRDLDPTRDSPQRTRMMVLLALFSVMFGSVISLRAAELTPRTSLLAVSVVLVILTVGLFVTRKKILTNAFNRRNSALLVGAIGFVLVNRIVGLAVDRPVLDTLTTDLVILSAMMFAGAVLIFRPLAPIAVIFLISVAAIRFWSDHAVTVFNVTMTVAMLSAAAVYGRSRRTK